MGCGKPKKGDEFECKECNFRIVIVKDCCCDDTDEKCMPCLECCGQCMTKVKC